MTDFGRRIALHSETHEDAGSDEIDAADLEGRATYVFRGDPSSYDFNVGDLTTDGNYRALDLSSIIPANCKLVHIVCYLLDDAVNSYIQFKKQGNTWNINSAVLRIHVANQANDLSFFVQPDADREIQYRATNTTFNNISIAVCGWFV